MNARPLVLDLYSGAGGSAMGFARAGCEMVGVDIVDQPAYPFEHRIENAVDFLLKVIDNDMCLPDGRRVHAVDASPPCQRYSALAKGTNNNVDEHPDLIPATRELLAETGVPWVMENVPSAPLISPITLCGEMFGLLVLRHRGFESNWDLPQPAHVKHRGRVKGWRHGRTYEGVYFACYGNGGQKGSLSEWKMAMGIDWMRTKAEIAEAIPPAYTEFIGREMLKAM